MLPNKTQINPAEGMRRPFFSVDYLPSHVAQFIQSIPSHPQLNTEEPQATTTKEYRNHLLFTFHTSHVFKTTKLK